MILRGRIIYPGNVEGEVVKCEKPVVILGDVVPERGTVEGCGEIKDKIFVFPRGAGSTVGSYTLYGLRYYNNAPRAMVVGEAEPIVVAGAIIAEIPTVDRVDISRLKTGDYIRLGDGKIEIL